MMNASELRGASKRYESLPSHAKESIDREMKEITAKVEAHEESKIKDGKNMLQAMSKDLTSYAYGFVLNGGHLNVPDSDFLESEQAIPCSYCHKVYGAVYRKGLNWCCEYCKDEVAGEVEDTFLNYKKGA